MNLTRAHLHRVSLIFVHLPEFLSLTLLTENDGTVYVNPIGADKRGLWGSSHLPMRLHDPVRSAVESGIRLCFFCRTWTGDMIRLLLRRSRHPRPVIPDREEPVFLENMDERYFKTVWFPIFIPRFNSFSMLMTYSHHFD